MNILNREDVKVSDQWDLSIIYAKFEAWEIDYKQVEKSLDKVESFKGELHKSVEILKSALGFYLVNSRMLEKVYVYSHLKSDQDTANSENLGNLEKALNLYSRFSESWSFLTPELLSLDDKTINSYLNSSELQPYKRMLEDIIRFKPHTLSTAEEKLLAAGGEVYQNAEKTFSQLNNADLNFGKVNIDGKEIPLSHGNYSTLLKNEKQSVRKKVFEQYYAVFDQHKNTISATLSGSIKKDVYLAKVKNFPSSRAKSTFADNIPLSVYDNLITTVSNNLKPLHRYYELRKRVLKLDTQNIYDTYVPLISQITAKHTYEEATAIILNSLKPLGDDYCNILAQGLTNQRWVDRFENKGKKSGAYSSGCYDTYPYILMNFKEDELRDVYTLTHEAGHSMHTYLSSKNQSYQDSGYTIFVAEVASTFNEQLLSKYLKELHANNPQMLAYLINNQIDDIKATLYRQTMFAEFELETHRICENNEPLTVDVFRGIYKQLLAKYFGTAVNLTELEELECLRIPHFYSSFYVYKYATGISAAVALSERVLKGGNDEKEQYLMFLKSGGSKYPLDVLKTAGVDISEPTPIEEALKLFDKLVTELEKILKV